MRAALHIKKTTEAITSETEMYHKIRMDAIKKYAETNENGDVVSDENGNIKFKSQDNLQSFLKELKELSDTDIVIPKIPLQYVENINISTDKLMYLTDVIDQPEE